MLSAPTIADLAAFTGRAVSSYGAYTTAALEQATLLFAIKTKLTEYPDEDHLAQLAKNAIMQMADQLVLEQPYQAVKASPLQSESIGAYSYTKTATWQKAQGNTTTGLVWWELALDELARAETSTVTSGSYTSFERNPAVVPDADGTGGHIYGPADAQTDDTPAWVNASRAFRLQG